MEADYIERILESLLDAQVALTADSLAAGDWHLGLLVPTGDTAEDERRLSIVAASRVLRNDDAINFRMAEGEGIGGRMWREWLENRASRTGRLQETSLEDYINSELLPPENFLLTSDISVCGVCVQLPETEYAVSGVFPGILCLGSDSRDDFPFFSSQEGESTLFEFGNELASTVGILSSLLDRIQAEDL